MKFVNEGQWIIQVKKRSRVLLSLQAYFIFGSGFIFPTYIYIYICVCVCVCVCKRTGPISLRLLPQGGCGASGP